MSSQYQYTQVIDTGKGLVTYYSNFPPGATPNPGDLVTMDIVWKYSIAQLNVLGYDVLHAFGQSTVESQLLTQLGYSVALQNYNVFALDASTERISFIMPTITTTGAPLLVPALTIVAVGIAIAIIAATAIGVAWVLHLLGGLIPYVIDAAPYVLAAVGVVAAIGLSAFVYDFLKERSLREEVYRGVGGAAKGTVKAGVGAAGSVAKAAVRQVPGVGRFAVSSAQKAFPKKNKSDYSTTEP